MRDAGRWGLSSQDPSLLLLEHHLKALRVPTVLRDYASVGAVCSQERCRYPQYLLRRVERELMATSVTGVPPSAPSGATPGSVAAGTAV